MTEQRHRLPNTRNSITHRVEICDLALGSMDAYITVGLYEDGSPGEVFVKIGKVGSTLDGLLDTVGILLSYAFQNGLPLEDICKKLRHLKYEPCGTTDNPDIPECSSLVDYIGHWLERRFLHGVG